MSYFNVQVTKAGIDKRKSTKRYITTRILPHSTHVSVSDTMVRYHHKSRDQPRNSIDGRNQSQPKISHLVAFYLFLQIVDCRTQTCCDIACYMRLLCIMDVFLQSNQQLQSESKIYHKRCFFSGIIGVYQQTLFKKHK